MAVGTALAIYFVIWWVVLFAVLPFGVRSQEERGTIARGSDPGAPAIPGLAKKLLATTVLSALLFAGGSVLHHYRLVTLDDLARWLPQP